MLINDLIILEINQKVTLMQTSSLSPIAHTSTPNPLPLNKEFSDSFNQIRQNLSAHHHFEGRSHLIEYLQKHYSTRLRDVPIETWVDHLFNIANSLQPNDSHFTDLALVVPNGFYLIGEDIGSGSYSKVFATTFCAFKFHYWANKKTISPAEAVENLVIKIAKKEDSSFLTEYETIQPVRHKEYIDYFIEIGSAKNENDDKRLSWAINRRFEGTLSTVQYSLYDNPVHTILNFAFNILTSLGELHKQNIHHGDIKGLNILVRNESAVLTDFGFSRKPEEHPKKTLGTEAYLDPKTFAHDGVSNILIHSKKYNGCINTLETDLYAVGRTILCDILCKFLIEKCPKNSLLKKTIQQVQCEGYYKGPFDNKQLVKISKKYPYRCYLYRKRMRNNSITEHVYVNPTADNRYKLITEILNNIGNDFTQEKRNQILHLSTLAIDLQHEDLSKRVVNIDKAKNSLQKLAGTTALTAQVAFPNLDHFPVVDLQDISGVGRDATELVVEMDETEIVDDITDEVEVLMEQATPQNRREPVRQLTKPQKNIAKLYRTARPRGKPNWLPVPRRGDVLNFNRRSIEV